MNNLDLKLVSCIENSLFIGSSGGVVVKMLVVKQDVWGSIPDFRDWLSPASKSQYG